MRCLVDVSAVLVVDVSTQQFDFSHHWCSHFFLKVERRVFPTNFQRCGPQSNAYSLYVRAAKIWELAKTKQNYETDFDAALCTSTLFFVCFVSAQRNFRKLCLKELKASMFPCGYNENLGIQRWQVTQLRF
jgi:hypothetical protein